MSNLLKKLLAAEEPVFSMSIKQLEESSGRPGMDVRLISDIIQRTHSALKNLGLDAKDTTGKELYQALMIKLKQHDELLARAIGGNDPADVDALLPLIKKAVDKTKMPRSAWVLKRSVAKKLLHDMPPTKIMQHLGYSSVESMTKRENLLEIFGALRFAESASWLKKFNSSYKSLTPSDFESRDIEVLVLDKKRWGSLAEGLIRERGHNVTHLKEMGVVLLLPPMMDKLPGITMTAMQFVLHYLSEIRVYSAFFKLQQVKPNFGKVIADTLNADVSSAAIMGGNKVHWRIIQRYYGEVDDARHPEFFEPHVQPEDLHWQRVEEYLFLLEPELNFWRGLNFVGVDAAKLPVSLNLKDVSMAYMTNSPYENRRVTHLRNSLWNELFRRYMGHKVLETQVLQQLDTNMIKLDKLTV